MSYEIEIVPWQADHEMVKDVMWPLPPKDNDGDQVCHDANEWDGEHYRPVDPVRETGINVFLT